MTADRDDGYVVGPLAARATGMFVSVAFHTLTPMFGAMPTQGEPRFLDGDALFLARLVCPIKLSTE